MFTYDTFISYKHGDPDREFALLIDSVLRKGGINNAFDERDFKLTEPFLSEMARCVQESRFVLILLSNRFLNSMNTLEEAFMTKNFDNKEKQRRLVCCYLEPCDPPLWITNLVGVRFYEKNPLVHPVKKLTDFICKGLSKDVISEVETDKVISEWASRKKLIFSGTALAVAFSVLLSYDVRENMFDADSNNDDHDDWWDIFS